MFMRVMAYEFTGEAQSRLERYVGRIGDVLHNKRRKASFATYFLGLLGDGERKSVEPIAARAAGEPEQTRAVTEQLLHFLVDSEWDDQRVRRVAAREAIGALMGREPMDCWIIDDTGFLKQGTKSPGVQRQYTGSAGKTTNCQLAPSLTLCTRTTELPVDMDLYIPQSWADDRERCEAARVPEELRFRAKWQIGLDLLRRAVEADYPRGVVLADCAYGDVGAFRAGVRALELDYGLDVRAQTRVRIVCSDGDEADTMSVAMVAEVVGARLFRRVSWREATQRTLWSRFACVRVRVVTDTEPNGGEEQWLIIDRPARDQPPKHYTLSTLPKNLSHKRLVRRLKQRWRIERTYEDLKGELGLDHFEGRTYPGWQHHVTCVLSCAAFVVAERVRAFPPSAGRSEADRSIACAA
jgi:SRSO17 transposase